MTDEDNALVPCVAQAVADAKRGARRITALTMVPTIAAAVIAYVWLPAAAIAPFIIGVGLLSGSAIIRVHDRFWGRS